MSLPCGNPHTCCFYCVYNHWIDESHYHILHPGFPQRTFVLIACFLSLPPPPPRTPVMWSYESSAKTERERGRGEGAISCLLTAKVAIAVLQICEQAVSSTGKNCGSGGGGGGGQVLVSGGVCQVMSCLCGSCVRLSASPSTHLTLLNLPFSFLLPPPPHTHTHTPHSVPLQFPHQFPPQ